MPLPPPPMWLKWFEVSREVHPCLFVGDGAVVYKHLFLELPGVCLPETTNYPTVAAAVARLGEDRFRSN